MELKAIRPEDLLTHSDELPPNPTENDVRKALALDSTSARFAFFRAVPCLDRDEVVKNMGMPTHASSPGHAALGYWRAQQRIFFVSDIGQERYPAFQFLANGQPHPTVEHVVTTLSAHRTAWQVAFWFVSPNGWLDGDMPANRLDDVQQTLAAAQREVEDIEG